MLDKIIKPLLLTMSMLFCLNGGVLAAEVVELNQLVENAEAMDGHTITVTGEAIGEAMERGDHAWININDGTNAMGIWIPLDDAQKIKIFGDYKHIGDQLQITGMFNRACSEHGGDVDIHCDSVKVVKSGYPIAESVPVLKIITGIVLVCLAVLISLIYLKVIKKSDG